MREVTQCQRESFMFFFSSRLLLPRPGRLLFPSFRLQGEVGGKDGAVAAATVEARDLFYVI